MKRVKKARGDIKDIVFRYARRYGKRWRYNVPVMIQYIRLDFYFMHEYFKCHGAHLFIDQIKRRKVECNRFIGTSGLGSNTVYGNVNIDLNDTTIEEYNWYFKIRNMMNHNTFIIGIDSYKNKLNRKFINSYFSAVGSNPSHLYAFGSNGRLYCHNKTNGNNRSNYIDGKKWKKRDLIQIKSSMANDTLELILNNMCEEIIYDLDVKASSTNKNDKNGSKRYCLAIELLWFTLTNERERCSWLHVGLNDSVCIEEII